MRVLVADDDPVTREALTACLRMEGYEPLPAADGAEALQLATERRPDVVCLDIMMPALDGFEVCRRLRERDRTTPVIFISAKNEEIDVVAGLELGADDFLRKPFGRHEFLARVRAALRRAVRRPAPPRSFTLRRLTVFPDELRAVRDGGSIDLTPREASILALLHEHAGRPVPRDVFLDRCWGLDYFPDSRTLDQHILVLRKKIEPDPARPEIIETVRGVGYRFVERASA